MAYNFNLTEYKNLVEELGSRDWRLRNELRIQLHDKKNEILSLQRSFTVGNISQVNYRIKSFILSQEKDLLAKLYKKEQVRLDKVES